MIILIANKNQGSGKTTKAQEIQSKFDKSIVLDEINTIEDIFNEISEDTFFEFKRSLDYVLIIVTQNEKLSL